MSYDSQTHTEAIQFRASAIPASYWFLRSRPSFDVRRADLSVAGS